MMQRASHEVPHDITERLQGLISRGEEEFDLAEAALLLAKDEYPALDVDAYLQRLDRLGNELRTRLPRQPAPEDLIVALNTFLFDELGFTGNTENFYDPRNSFLNEVLDRKLGIPITLSIVYMEIARRVGLALEGVSFPGHFLVKLPTHHGDLVLDPFAGGIPVSEEDLLDRLEETYGELPASTAELPRLLTSAGNKDILLRMLRNLRGIYQKQEHWDKALNAANHMLLIAPNVPADVRDRGELYERLECFRAALADYNQYLRLQPGAPDAIDIRGRVVDLDGRVARLN
jgi:regulator of sirC expression with transglutaminase-like and TPR domain